MSEGRQSIVRLLEGITAFFLLLMAVLRPLAAANLWWPDEPTSRLGDTIYVSLPVWIALVFWLLRCIAAGRMTLWRAGGDALLMVVVFLVLLSPRPPADPNTALPAAMVWATNILYLYLVVHVGREARFARWVLAAILCTAVAVTVHAAIQLTVELPVLKEQLRDPAFLKEYVEQEGNAEQLQELQLRAESARPYSTFINENSLAGYLVLAIFPLLGLLLEAPSGNWRQSVRSILLLGMLVILWFTKSKGGFCGLAAGLYAFLWAARVGWFSRPSFRWGTAGIGLLGVAALVALAWTPIDPLGLRVQHSSADMRLGYWTGAIRVARAHPWLGVGLENFSDHYYEVKDATAGDVYSAHNDYLQVAADLGVFAFLAFVGFWAMLLARSFRVPAESAEAEREGPVWLRFTPLVLAAVAAAAFGTLVAEDVSDDFFSSIERPFSALALATAWIFGLVALRPAPRQASTRWVRAGALAGLCAVLAHALVDSHFYAHNLSIAIWGLAGVVVVLFQDVRGDVPILDAEMGTGGRALTLFIALAFAGVLGGAIVPIMWRAREEEAIFRAAREGHTLPDYFKACQLAPWDPKPQLGMAFSRHDACRFMSREKLQEETGLVGQPLTLEATRHLPDRWLGCLPPLKEAIGLAPRDHSLRWRLGRFHEDHADKAYEIAAKEEGPQRQALEQHGVAELEQALEAYLESHRLHPTRPETSLRIGRVLERLKRDSEARPYLEKALALHRLQYLERLKLPKDEVDLLERQFGGR